MNAFPISAGCDSPLQFYLLPAGFDPASARGVLPPGALPVPGRVSFLELAGGPRLADELPTDNDAVGVLEPILTRARQPALLLLTTGGTALRLNGHAAPRVSLLRERDQLELPDGTRFHVAARHRPSVGPPTAEQVGRKCPLCLQAVGNETRVYTCLCGSPLHAEADQPDGNALQCVQLVTACPTCERSVVRSEGWSWLPEDADA